MASRIAVGFDFDHTLGVDHRLERTVALDTLATYARDHAASYDLAGAEHAVEETLASYRSGALTVEIAIAAFLERFVPVSGAAVMDVASGFRDAVLARAKEFVAPIDGASDVLAALARAEVPVALLTNGWSPLQEEKARLIGFSGPVFVSERIGARKPDPAAFALLAEHFERPPVDIWYVGDDPVADCGGALAAGMRAVWFDWEGHAYPSDVPAPTHRIARLAEIVELLQGRD